VVAALIAAAIIFFLSWGARQGRKAVEKPQKEKDSATESTKEVSEPVNKKKAGSRWEKLRVPRKYLIFFPIVLLFILLTIWGVTSLFGSSDKETTTASNVVAEETTSPPAVSPSEPKAPTVQKEHKVTPQAAPTSTDDGKGWPLLLAAVLFAAGIWLISLGARARTLFGFLLCIPLLWLSLPLVGISFDSWGGITRWGGLGLLALLGGFMAWKSNSWIVRVIGGILVLPIIIAALSGPSAGDRFADNLGKTVIDASDGVGEKLGGLTSGEGSTTGTIKLKGEITTVWLDGHWRNMPIPSGTCTLTSPGSLIEFEFPNQTLTRMRSQSGEKIQATVTMKPYGTC